LPVGPLGKGETVEARVDTILRRVDLRSSDQIPQAVELLIELGPAAIPALVEQLRVPGVKPAGGVDRRYLIARALRVHGGQARAAIPLLVPLLGGEVKQVDQPQPADSNIKVAIIEGGELRNAAAEALGSIGAAAVPTLTAVMRGSDPEARKKALTALHYMPPGALASVEVVHANALVVAAMDVTSTITEQLTQIRAIEAITQLPRVSAIKALPALRALAVHGDRYVAPAAERAIEQLGSGPE
jgi:HEAT repeat protein